MITVLFGAVVRRNTARLTKMALSGHDYKWFDLTQYQLHPVRDVRHDGTKIDTYEDDYKNNRSSVSQ